MKKRIIAAMTAFVFVFSCFVWAGNVIPARAAETGTIEPLTIEGENFVNAAGETVRFWGFNLVSLYPTVSQADGIAAALADREVNVVRLHHNLRNSADWNNKSGIYALNKYEKESTREPNEEAWERFDYLNAKLREYGIYTRPSLDSSRVLGANDVYIDEDAGMDTADRTQWQAAVRALQTIANKAGTNAVRDLRRMLPMIDERAMELQKEFIHQYLTHENENTGLTYGEDPQTLTLEVMNETSTEYAVYCNHSFDWNYSHLNTSGTVTEEDFAPLSYFNDKLTAKWHAYLDSIGMEHFGLYGISGTETAKLEARSNFLRKLDEDYFKEIEQYVKEDLDCDIPITFSNLWRGDNGLSVNAQGDYIEDHSYSNPFVVSQKKDMIETLNSVTRVADKPYFVGEINQAEGGENMNWASRTTLPVALAAYGSFHNWAGINFFAWNHGDRNLDANGHPIDQYRLVDSDTKWSTSSDAVIGYLVGEMQGDGMMMDHMRTCGLIFKNGLVTESTQPAVVYTDNPYWAGGYQQLMTPKAAANDGWGSIYSIRRAFTDGGVPLSQKTDAPYLTEDAPDDKLMTDTNEIEKDLQAQQMFVNAPQAEAFSGLTDAGQNTQTNHMKISGTQKGSASVVLVSDDGNDLGTSRSMVLSRTAVAFDYETYDVTTGSGDTEYYAPVTLTGLQQPEEDGHWEMKITRSADAGTAAGTVTTLTMQDGALSLPGNWNECEVRYVSDGVVITDAALGTAGGKVNAEVVISNGGETALSGKTAAAASYQGGNLVDVQLQQMALQPGNNTVAFDGLETAAEEWITLDETADTFYVDETAADGSAYQYRVQAYRGDTPLGESVPISLPDAGTLHAPRHLAVETKDQTVSLTWDSVGPDVSYRVYRDGSLIADNVRALGYQDTGLLAESWYTYQVTAVQNGKESVPAGVRVRTKADMDALYTFYADGQAQDVYADVLTAAMSGGPTSQRNSGAADNGSFRITLSGTSNDYIGFVNHVWRENRGANNRYFPVDFTGIKDSAALVFDVNPYTDRQRIEVGLVGLEEDGSLVTLRVDIKEMLSKDKYAEMEFETLSIPLKTLAQQGIYAKNGLAAAAGEASDFDWTRVVGVSCAVSMERAGHAIRFNNLKLADSSGGTLPDEFPSAQAGALTWDAVDGADRYVVSRAVANYLKFFVWDSKGSLRPLAQPYLVR